MLVTFIQKIVKWGWACLHCQGASSFLPHREAWRPAQLCAARSGWQDTVLPEGKGLHGPFFR